MCRRFYVVTHLYSQHCERVLESLFKEEQSLFVKQQKEWAEIMADYETANKYALLDSQKRPIGFAAEAGGGGLDFLNASSLGPTGL